ncbi:hypothetical protein Pmani_031848 [Petrolisthes manimaculis]|uniref:SH3 domain-containing protein n=1 Tax=Petrolisthes manimaculis TaxID=1843537 RepID=A0AAE1NSX0_9EUCA|nr:hypothetical protein Pmani_031848 [Petrolisthes manimaculis]
MNCTARALYDNVAESPDELEFRRNDILTVLEQNTAGLEGWWLCSLRGRQGICPGNRLRIVPGVFDTGSGVTVRSTLASPHGSVPSSTPTTPSSRPGTTSPAPAHRTQQRPLSNKVVTPRRVGDVYTYDTPRALTHNQQAAQFDYDVPPTKHSPHDSGGARLSRSSSLRYDCPRPHVRSSLDQYDIPRSQYDSPKVRPLYDSPRPQQHYDSPRSHTESHRVGPRSLIKGVRGGAPPTVPVGSDNNQEYDVPKPTNTNQEPHFDMQPSDRSSGVSVMSCDSSQLSTSSSNSSLAASESPSLSSLGGSSNRSSMESHDVYDIPPEPRKVGMIQRPKLPPRESKESRDTYDVPRSMMAAGCETYDTPPSRIPRSLIMRGIGGEGVYDVPPQISRDVRQADCVDSVNRLSSGSDSSGGEVDLNYGKELHLEYDSALDTLTKLQQEAYGTIEKLTVVHQNGSWRARETVEEREEDLKIVLFKLEKAISEFIEFGQDSAFTAARKGEPGVARRIQRLIEPVSKSSSVIRECYARLHGGEWRQSLTCGTTPDNLNLLAITTRSLVDEVCLLASTIQTKAKYIFKKSPGFDVTGNSKQQCLEDDEKTPVQERPLPDLPNKILENMYENDSRNWLEDYDYVNLETRESMEREHEDIKKELPARLRKSFDNLVKQSQLIVDSDHEKALRKYDSSNTVTEKRGSSTLDPNDRQVITFYGNQAELHLQHLNTAIDAFLLTIENNQPPKVFIAHSKFVILNAHKLVYIGDTVHRNVVNAEVRTRVLNCSNALCDAMKNTVTAAKTAALQFPSVSAVQAMVDAFVSVSHLANNLKQAVSPTPV